MQPYLITTIAVQATCLVVYAWIAYKLYLEFGWTIFKRIGADPKTLGAFFLAALLLC